MALDLSGLMAPLAAPPTAAAEFTRTFYQPQQQALAQQLGQAQVGTLQQKLAEAPLEEQLKQAQIGGLQGQQVLLPFKAALMQAQAQKAQELAKHPYLSKPLTGPAAEIASIEQLKKQYPDIAPGVPSPQVKRANAKFDAQTKMWNQRGDFVGLSPVGRIIKNRTLLEAAHAPQQEIDQLNSELGKKLSDPKARQIYMSFNGVVNELNNVNMPDISRYAGPQGYSLLKQDELAASFGKSNPYYRKYRNFKFQAKIITDQLRQALGTSTRNAYVMNMLYPVVNNLQEVWGNNPVLALNQWKWLLQWSHQYRDMYYKYATEGILPGKKNAINEKILNDPGIQSTAPGMQHYAGTVGAQAPQSVQAAQTTKPAPPVPKDQWITVMMKDPKTKGSGITRPQLEAYFDAHFDVHAKKEGQ
jgi:hypothetical protein